MSGVYEESEYVFCDLQNVFRYFRRRSPATAEAFLEATYDTFEFLAENPGLGQPRSRANRRRIGLGIDQCFLI